MAGSERPWISTSGVLRRAARAAIGVPGIAGELAATALVEAEQLGERRSGLSLLAGVVRGEERCALPPPLTRAAGAIEFHSVAGLFGPVVLASMVEQLVLAARADGVAMVVLKDLGGLGRLAPYVRWVASQGLVGVLAVDGPPFVVPHGGGAPVLGTNPIAFAIPAEPRPVVVDVSPSSITMAALMDARAAQRALPVDVAVDDEGRPTTRADDAAAARPRGGLVGTLLALLVESLTGALTGSLPDTNRRTGTVLVLRPIDARPLVGTRLVEAIATAGARTPGTEPLPEDGPITLEPAAMHVLDRLVPGWHEDAGRQEMGTSSMS